MSDPVVHDSDTWGLIHTERAALAGTLGALAPGRWSEPSLCTGWSVRVAAAHVLAGAEQTPGRLFRRMAANGFRFDTMMDREARRLAAASPPPTSTAPTAPGPRCRAPACRC
ncbi:MAG TPA: maleylpyruvate isomerase N-terminal domain-containing protein [Acidimicrobiales bacterium]|nr:maleylpyruvate isomerase N-terminal domain-containing protein [Acidimicrobiales bacterium]